MTIFIALVVFGVIVLFHEFGHFIVAKLCKVKVHEFAIGMGPKIASIKGKETDYSIRLLPLGGYVKMLGEDEDSEDENSFGKKSVLQRIGIIAAGPIMNFVLAILLFTVIFMLVGIPTTSIKETMKDYPAQSAGIIEGDKIIEIEGTKIEDWNQVTSIVGNSAGKSIEIKIQRAGKPMEYKVTPLEQDGRGVIGILPSSEKNLALSLKSSVERTGYILSQMMNFFATLVTGNVNTSDVVGPVGIINVVGEAARVGYLNVISLAAVISINLGLINLFPFPALDGSRILFLIIELARGKKIDPEKEGMIHFIGFALLMLLMVFITYKDIIKLIDK
ncbi:putative zinc metalloprotease [Peptoclostridium acidaminophilum DSM 3953]|uniref:Zinc metalloprotease n=1 Tax=Peptoclostridium acidaminophilum DSM 3953 TaxID=1286171 RepID=W8TFN7_PEPAC|nr:RIP metalloprotease RseP [Peptoclostridium acidaminophilum]AHM56623.1 putative zinc metalloprotease [Peptoclostridium acidaminophilum DSM 3953]